MDPARTDATAFEAPGFDAATRRRVIDLLNEALSAEYHSFVGHVLGSNPYLAPGTEKDLDVLDRIRDEENDNTRALLTQLGRYRAGPTLRAFRWWKNDLNFLGLDFLVVKAAEVAKEEAARTEALLPRLPDDPELRATFQGLLATKRRHAEELGKLAVVRAKERQARRDAAFKATAIPLKKPAPAGAAAAPKPAGAMVAAPGAPAAPKLPGAPSAPKLPGAPSAPKPPGAPSAPKPPSPPLPSAGPKPPGAPSPPRPPSPPLPPGAPKPPSGPPKPPAS